MLILKPKPATSKTFKLSVKEMKELCQLLKVLNMMLPSKVSLFCIDMKFLIHQFHLEEPMKIKNLLVSDIHGPDSSCL